MGTGGAGVADAVDDCHVAAVIDVLQRGHLRVEANLVVNLDDPLFGNAYGRAVVPVQRVAVGDDGIQVVVAPGELEHYQNRVFLGAGHTRPSSCLPFGSVESGARDVVFTIPHSAAVCSGC